MILDDEDFPPEPAPQPARKPVAKVAAKGSEDEILLVGATMADPDRLLLAKASHLPEDAFVDPVARALWSCLKKGLQWPGDIKKIIKETKVTVDELLKIESGGGVGVGFGGWMESIEEAYRARQFQKMIAEAAQNPGNPLQWAERVKAIYKGKQVANAVPLTKFKIPNRDDNSVLLGDRYLNRGDAMVLSSTSGMGKSSLDLQMAAMLGVGRPFFGIKPNKPLKSLIIQAEDSDGDIGEVWESIKHEAKFTDEELALLEKNVIVVNERVRRGQDFIDYLRALIALHKPDLVHINPLQAYVDGDITNSQDLGNFLRAGLNGLNEPATFAYVVIHHTTKPAKGKDRQDALWHEVMYDMAGGAEIINWARAIMSLRASAEKGEFELVLAKRGTRAGVTRKTPQGAGFRTEIVTKIYLKHSDEEFEVEGLDRKLRCIYWVERDAPETGDDDTGSEKTEKKGRGATKKFHFKDLIPVMPRTRAVAASFSQIFRDTRNLLDKPSPGTLSSMLKEALADGVLKLDNSDPKRPKYWVD